MKKIKESKYYLVLMIICWLLLLWARSAIGLANGSETDVYTVLATALTAVMSTVCFGVLILKFCHGMEIIYKDDIDDVDDNWHRYYLEDSDDQSELKMSMGLILFLAVLCMISLAFPGRFSWLDMFSKGIYMQVGVIPIDKRYLFGILILIIFPLWSTYILRKMRQSGFEIVAVLNGSLQILVLTVMGLLLYKDLPNIWLIEMVVVNFSTLILAVRSYVWRKVVWKGEVVGLLILYGIACVSFLSIFHYKAQTLVDYMGFSDTSSLSSYFTNVKKIVENASFIGSNSVLVNDEYVLDFLKESHYLLPNVLFYGGWLPAILVMLVEVVLLISAAVVIKKNQAHDGRDILLQTIWFWLFFRVVCGTLYSFGVPVPIMLPFTGTVGVAMDSMCIGILLFNFLYNWSVEEEKLFRKALYKSMGVEDEEDEENEENEEDY